MSHKQELETIARKVESAKEQLADIRREVRRHGKRDSDLTEAEITILGDIDCASSCLLKAARLTRTAAGMLGGKA